MLTGLILDDSSPTSLPETSHSESTDGGTTYTVNTLTDFERIVRRELRRVSARATQRYIEWS